MSPQQLVDLETMARAATPDNEYGAAFVSSATPQAVLALIAQYREACDALREALDIAYELPDYTDGTPTSKRMWKRLGELRKGKFSESRKPAAVSWSSVEQIAAYVRGDGTDAQRVALADGILEGRRVD